MARRNILHATTRLGLRDSLVKRLLGHVHQPLRFDAAATDRHGPGSVADETVIEHSHIKADNISEGHSTVRCQSVDDFVVH